MVAKFNSNLILFVFLAFCLLKKNGVFNFYCCVQNFSACKFVEFFAFCQKKSKLLYSLQGCFIIWILI
jgi:hypothetical protein